MGVINDDYFQSSALRSPKNIKNPIQNMSMNREAQLMKKIG